MAQGDYLIQNQSFPSFRSDLNDTLEAINTSNSGTSRPSSAVAGTVWLDTTSATTPTLKFYDGTDDISLATLDYTANTVNWLDSSVVADLVNDTTPQLGGDLDVNGNDIVSVSGGNITFTPDGAGKVIIDGLSHPTADGTSGQFLKTDGSGNLSFDTVDLTTLSATNLTSGTVAIDRLGTSGTKDATTFLRGDNTFATVSSDYVKLSSTTPSAANTFSIDGHFTSDYDIYKVYVIGVSGASMSNTRISMRVNVSGTAQTGSNYYHHTNIASGTSVNGNWINGSTSTDSDIGYAHNSSGSTAQANFELTIYRPLASDKTTILHDGIAADNGSTWGRYSGFTTWNVATAISGITLGVGDFGTGNIEADRISVYGLKI